MNRISDKELNMLIDIYKDYENLHEEAIYEAAAELKHYRELAAQGQLIELPCAVGDTIYDPETGKPFDKVIQFVIDENGVHCKTLSVLAEMRGAE